MRVDKRALRQDLRARRKRLTADAVAAASAAVWAQLRVWPVYATAAAVVGYLDDENEISTRPILDESGASGRALYLPVDADGVPALGCWRLGERTRVGRWGIAEPGGAVTTTVELPGVALVPLVAWDRRGTRLGRGGGFYDRLFVRLDPRIVRVGLAYEFQEVPELPRDSWDVSLQYVITERRIVTCGERCEGQEPSFQKGGLQV